MPDAILEVFRGNQEAGAAKQYTVPIAPGMVVLDALHYIQAHLEPDLAVRWNCKAGKCGSCSAEVNGKPRLTCKTRMDALPTDKPITVYPMKSFPVIKDLVTDVSWNYRVNKKIPPFSPKPKTDWKMYQEDMDRVQEFRKCIECFLCQNVCHVVPTTTRKKSLAARVSLCVWLHWRCIRWITSHAPNFSKTSSALAIATSPSAALRSALKKSRSRTMPSFRSKSG